MKTFKRILLIVAASALTQCGPASNNSSAPCIPNVVDTGLQLSVVPLSAGSNVFTFELCAAPTTASVFSVYAGINQAAVAQATINVNAAQRIPVHVTDADTAGVSFQVTFTSSDVYFAIYQDKDVSGTYVLDSTTSLVQPHEIPSR